MTTPTPASPSDLLTYEEASAFLGISVGAVKAAVSNGKLNAIKLPGSIRKYLRREDVESYPQRRYVAARLKEKPASETPDADKLRELAAALSGPTIEAMRIAQETSRDAQATTRHGIEGLVRIAIGLAVGASGQLLDPKQLAG